KVIAELTLGFWVRLMNAEYERILWKDLRRAFPYMIKHKRQRHNVSAPLNKIRNFRNRVFHHEPICWDLNFIRQIHIEILEVLDWINKDLQKWIQPLDRVPSVIIEIEKQLK